MPNEITRRICKRRENVRKQRRFRIVLSTFAACVLGLVVSCGGGGKGGTNSTPVANAGSNQTVMAGWLLALDGSRSSNASTYSWSFMTKPAGSTATLSSSTVSKPTFTADKAGSYTVSLVVNNGTASSYPDTVTVTAVSPRPVPDTGQTTLYAAGDDSTYLSSAPSYTDNGDGTITDRVTGLMWQKCLSGQSGALCSTGTATTYNWFQANGTANANFNPGGVVNICGDLTVGGYSDWRLPTDFELMSIADYGGAFGSAINTTYFSPTPVYASNWSSNSAVGLDTYAWYMDYLVGSVSYGGEAAGNYVRCIRGEQSAPVLADNGNGTITDNVTGLMWQQQDDGLKKTWLQALTYCGSLSLGGHSDWRLPNVKELSSIIDYTRGGPAINTSYFPGTPQSPSTYYWSSTTDYGSTANAWCADFYSGSVDPFNMLKTGSNYARCVR